MWIPRETRICACGCNRTFECKVNSKRKYFQGHGSRGKKMLEITKDKLRLINLGKKMSEESIKKRKENAANNPNYGMKNKHHTKKTKLAISNAKIGKPGTFTDKKHSIETKIQLSKKASLHGTGGFGGYKRGYFIDRFGISHYFASSYEEKRMQFLNFQGIDFQKKHLHTIIWYDDNNENHAYTPDLFIEENTLEEIKPKYKLNDRDVMLKAIAAQEYCKENNLNYRIVTENDLEKIY